MSQQCLAIQRYLLHTLHFQLLSLSLSLLLSSSSSLLSFTVHWFSQCEAWHTQNSLQESWIPEQVQLRLEHGFSDEHLHNIIQKHWKHRVQCFHIACWKVFLDVLKGLKGLTQLLSILLIFSWSTSSALISFHQDLSQHGCKYGDR